MNSFNQVLTNKIGSLYTKGKLLIPNMVIFIVVQKLSYQTINSPSYLYISIPLVIGIYLFYFDLKSTDKKKKYITDGGYIFMDFIVHCFHSLAIFGIGLFLLIQSMNFFLATRSTNDEITKCKISSLTEANDDSHITVNWKGQNVYIAVRQSILYSINESNSSSFRVELITCKGFMGSVIIKSSEIIKVYN